MNKSLNKTKLTDPFIASLVENIRNKRVLLNNIEIMDINNDFTNIVSENESSNFYIKNEFHKANGFRKLHIEIAEFSGKLKILHCVWFPDPLFNIPIFGLDLVIINNFISAAIVDLSPVSKACDNEYISLMSKVNKEGFCSKRKIPEWGDIFSKEVFFASLANENEQKLFYKIVDQYLSILLNISVKSIPDNDNELIEERINYQKKYCIQQMKNDKTSQVLLKYFQKSWVDRYIKEVLFDF